MRKTILRLLLLVVAVAVMAGCVLIALLKEASRLYEQTIVMITHSQSIAQTADRILRVSDGVVTDFGRCRE